MDSKHLKSIVDALPYPAMVLSTELHIRCANATAQNLFGQALDGLSLSEIVQQSDVIACMRQAIKTQNMMICELVLNLHTPRTYEASAAIIKTSDEQNKNLKDVLLFTLNDISAGIDAERSRSTFVANVSHELRSPLTSLMGIVETLKGPARNDEAARDRFLDLMQGETSRMSRLVGDLLSLSKLEAKEHLAPEGEVNILRLIHRVTTVLSESTPAYKNRVYIDAPDHMNSLIGDPDELVEVFQNLIENALKYSTPATPVTINILQTEAQTLIHIKDISEGIAPKHLSRLTERFYRADKGRSRDMGGTGLGLAITKHILNRHRATLSIESKIGEGTIVTVTLPTSSP